VKLTLAGQKSLVHAGSLVVWTGQEVGLQ